MIIYNHFLGLWGYLLTILKLEMYLAQVKNG